jgi:hypothetical protein
MCAYCGDDEGNQFSSDEMPDWDHRRVEQDWLCSSCDPRSDLARMRDGEWPVPDYPNVHCADCDTPYVENDMTAWSRWTQGVMAEAQRENPGSKFTCE